MERPVNDPRYRNNIADEAIVTDKSVIYLFGGSITPKDNIASIANFH